MRVSVRIRVSRLGVVSLVPIYTYCYGAVITTAAANKTRCNTFYQAILQYLKHDVHQVYLGVTLDHTLSNKQHLTKTANKVKSGNNFTSSKRNLL